MRESMRPSVTGGRAPRPASAQPFARGMSVASSSASSRDVSPQPSSIGTRSSIVSPAPLQAKPLPASSRFHKIQRHTFKFVWSSTVSNQDINGSMISRAMQNWVEGLAGVEIYRRHSESHDVGRTVVTLVLSSHNRENFKKAFSRVCTCLVRDAWRQQDERSTAQRNKQLLRRLMTGGGESEANRWKSVWMRRSELNDNGVPYRHIYTFLHGGQADQMNQSREALRELQHRYESKIVLKTNAMVVHANSLIIEDFSLYEMKRIRALVNMYMSESKQRLHWRAVHKIDPQNPATEITVFVPTNSQQAQSRPAQSSSKMFGWLGPGLFSRRVGPHRDERNSRSRSRPEPRNTVKSRRSVQDVFLDEDGSLRPGDRDRNEYGSRPPYGRVSG